MQYLNFHIVCVISHVRVFSVFSKTSSFVSKGSCNLYFGVMVKNILQSLSSRLFELWPAVFAYMEGPLIFVKSI